MTTCEKCGMERKGTIAAPLTGKCQGTGSENCLRAQLAQRDAEIARLKSANAELLEALCGVVARVCQDDAVTWNDGGVSSLGEDLYADALRLLARLGKVEITTDAGRRVVARWRT